MKSKKHVVIVILSGVFVILHIMLYKPFFLNSDDVFMNLVSAGIGFTETPNEYIMFMHIWIGQALKLLYTTWPNLPHYGVLLLLITFVSIIVLNYVITANLSLFHSLMTIVLLMIIVFHAWLVNISFTHAAFLAASASIFIAAMGLYRQVDWKLICLQIVLMVFSLLIRAESFILAFLCYSPFLVYLVIRSQIRMKAFLRLIAFILIFSSCYAILDLYNDYYYDNSMNSFGNKYHNDIHVPIIDYKRIDSQQVDSTRLNNYGLSQIDLAIFGTWFSIDTSLFKYDGMKDIISQFPNYRDDLSLRSVLGVVWRRLFNINHTIILVLIGLNLILLSSVSQKVSILSIIWSLILCGILFFWMKLPERVSLPIMAAQILVSQTLIGLQGPLENRMKQIVYAGLCLFYLLFCIVYFQRFYNKRHKKYLANQELMSILPKDSTYLYIAWAGSVPFDIAPFDQVQELKPLRLVWIGPPLHMNYSRKTLELYGIRDLGWAMNNSENIFISQTEEVRAIYSTYIRQRYGQDLHSKICFSDGFYNIYCIQPPN